MKNTDISIRMKRYELPTQQVLSRRTYTIIRIDGKAFHTYTKGLKKPFDEDLIEDMNATAEYLCQNIQGTKFAYTQSDEISIFITDFDTLESQLWFDGNVQKITSISASLATAKFNQSVLSREANKQLSGSIGNIESFKLAHFDSRVFQLPTRTEALNYLKWRYMDCERNSVSSVAQTHFSPKELHGKGRVAQLKMLDAIGISWDLLSPDKQYGRITKKIISHLSDGQSRNKWETVPALLSGEGWLELLPENT